jgi:hypothetical protein
MSNTTTVSPGVKGLVGWFQRRTSTWRGVGIVVLAALLSEVTAVIRSERTSSGFGGGATVGAVLYITAVLGAAIAIATWAISTLIIHGTSRLLKGKGSLRRFFAMNGFAYIPILVQGLLSVADVSLTGGTVVSPLANQPALEVLLTQFNLLNLAALVLSGIAVTVNYKLSRKRAAVAVLVPVVIFLVLDFMGVPLGGGRSTGRGFSLFPRGAGGIRITPGG